MTGKPKADQSRTTGATEGLKGESGGQAEELDDFGRGDGRGRLGGTIGDKGDLELGRADGDEGDLELDEKRLFGAGRFGADYDDYVLHRVWNYVSKSLLLYLRHIQYQLYL